MIGSAVYLALFVLRPLTWRINPYYAARQLEKELPGAKNSVVNWIDLHDHDRLGRLPGLVRSPPADLAHQSVLRRAPARKGAARRQEQRRQLDRPART